MHIARVNNQALNWREDGDPAGHPVVFANSLGTDLRLWDAVIPLLPQGLRVIRFDKRGHGLSSCPPGPYSIDDLVTDTVALLDHLGIAGCTFVGLSVGGMICQALAARRPDLVADLVLSNTAARMGDPAIWQERIDTIAAGGIEAMADPILERWFAPSFRQSDAVEAWRNMLIRTPRAGYIATCQAIAAADLSATTAQLSLPVLGIAGELDGASPPELVKATVALIPGAKSHVISGVGHLPCVEEPAQYAALLTEFLQETGHV